MIVSELNLYGGMSMEEASRNAEKLEQLTRDLLRLGGMVETAIARSITALFRRDRHLAEAIIQEDAKIDEAEVMIEKQCIEILEDLHPTGAELRYVVAVLKINDSLERMGDLAENIAESVVEFARAEGFVQIGDFREMAERTQAMIKHCLKSLISHDATLAYRVIDDDQHVDKLLSDLTTRIQRELEKTDISPWIMMRVDYVGRQLERICDLATNIAEDVIYMVDGEIVRHPQRFQKGANVFSVGSSIYRRVV